MPDLHDCSLPPGLRIETTDILLRLQLSVARRADELVRWEAPSLATDRRAWLRAEQELFARLERGAGHHRRELAARVLRQPIRTIHRAEVSCGANLAVTNVTGA